MRKTCRFNTVIIREILARLAHLYSRERNALPATTLFGNCMPIQRRTPTQEELDERNKLREEKARIHDWQVDALEKLYYRDDVMSQFILAIKDQFPTSAGESTDVLQIAKVVGKPVKRTCELLLELSETGIGGPGTKRMILDEAKPFTRFRWNGNFDDLVQRLIAKWDTEQSEKAS